MATIPEYRALTPAALDALEGAVRDHLRVALRRRGTEYVVVAERLETSGRDDVLAGRLPMTGELLTFPLRRPERLAGLPLAPLSIVVTRLLVGLEGSPSADEALEAAVHLRLR